MRAIPRSKARTAYGLISDVRRAILAEPRRVDMGVYCVVRDPSAGGPACGTVGCFAGWVLLLRGQTEKSIARGLRSDIDARHPAARARRVLGRTLDYSSEGGADVFNDGEDEIYGTPGTAEYASQVAKRITYFQQVNAKALKARRLA